MTFLKHYINKKCGPLQLEEDLPAVAMEVKVVVQIRKGGVVPEGVGAAVELGVGALLPLPKLDGGAHCTAGHSVQLLAIMLRLGVAMRPF